MLHRREFIQTSAGAIAMAGLPTAARAATWKTIDAQVHAYERNRPERPWAGVLTGPDEMTGDQMVAAMDAVGVDGAVLVSPFTMYQYDPSYVLEVEAKHADRFCLVKPVNPNDPAVAESIADWKTKKGTVGIRILMRDNVSTDPGDPGINRVLAAAAKHSLAVNLSCSGRLEQVAQMAARNPNTQLVVAKGAPNKITHDIKETILAALDKAGGVKYLVRQATENPAAFMTRVGHQTGSRHQLGEGSYSGWPLGSGVHQLRRYDGIPARCGTERGRTGRILFWRWGRYPSRRQNG
jgi:hypothetical protein